MAEPVRPAQVAEVDKVEEEPARRRFHHRLHGDDAQQREADVPAGGIVFTQGQDGGPGHEAVADAR